MSDDRRIETTEEYPDNVIDDIDQRTLFLNAKQIRVTLGHELKEEIPENQRVEALGLLASGVVRDFSYLMTGLMENVGFVWTCRKTVRAKDAWEQLGTTPLVLAGRQTLSRHRLTVSDGLSQVQTLTALGSLIEEWLEFAFLRCDVVTVEIAPFFTTTSKCSGLGLAVTFSTSRQNNGGIDVRRRPSRVTTESALSLEP